MAAVGGNNGTGIIGDENGSLPEPKVKTFETQITIYQDYTVTQKVANTSEELKELAIASDKKFTAKPLKVSEALILLLEKIKSDSETLQTITKEIASSKTENPKEQEYQLLLLKLLTQENTDTRAEVEKLADIEKEWVLIENDGIPNCCEDYQKGPGWGTYLLKGALSIGKGAFSVGLISGKIGYRLYVESTRIGTIALLGVMVIQNPLFPVLQTLLQVLIKVLVK